MIGLVIAAHGNLAQEILSTAEMIGGPLEKVQTVAIHSREGLNDLENKLKAALDKVNGSQGVLILIDIFGGSPATVSLSFIERYKIKVISGVNLPVILEIAIHRKLESLEKLAALALGAGQKSILMADEIFRRKKEGNT